MKLLKQAGVVRSVMGRAAALFFATLLLSVASPLWVENSWAADETKKLSKAEKEARLKYRNSVTQRRKSVGKSCAKKLEKAQGFFEEEDWTSAESALASAANRGCTSGFERSQVNRYLGYVYYAQDKIPAAIQAYMALIDEPDADPQQRTATRYTVAQLRFMTENFPAAIEQLEAWQREAVIVDPGGEILLARAYHQVNRKDEALALVERVVVEVVAAGVVPKESWLNFQWALYYERANYRATILVSNRLLANYPKVKYWKQLSAMYGALSDAEKEMLALEVTYLQDGLDKEKQFVALAYQYLAIDIPYRAAQVLDKAMADDKVERSEKNLEILGSAYQRAQEFKKASPILEEAAKQSEDGGVWSRLSSVYLNLNENKKALVAARNALKKGGLKREELAWMNRGSAEAALHCYRAAEKSFNRASKFEKTEKGAKNWKKYVKNEGDRRRKLIANGAPLATCIEV